MNIKKYKNVKMKMNNFKNSYNFYKKFIIIIFRHYFRKKYKTYFDHYNYIETYFVH